MCDSMTHILPVDKITLSLSGCRPTAHSPPRTRSS